MNRRIRIATGIALIAVGLIALTVAAQETYIGLLGETVEMTPYFGSATKSIDLSETPLEALSAVPQGVEILYGVIMLGNGVDTRISVAVRLGENPLLWIDANNNEDLYDDSAPTPDAIYSPTSCAWYREVSVSYWEDGVHSTAPYVLRISAIERNNEWDLIYTSYCARKGLIRIGARLHTLWLSDSDTDGLFNDITELTVMIDNDSDGEVDFSYRSPEAFSYNIPFIDQNLVQIDASFYQVIDASSDGRTITLETHHPEIDPLPTLQVGYPAPLQTASTIAGDVVDLSDYLGQPLLLLFAPLFQLYSEHLGDCPPSAGNWFSSCISEHTCPRSSGQVQALQRTQQLIAILEQESEDLGFGVVLVASDVMIPIVNPQSTFYELNLPFLILWDESLGFRYRSGLYDAIIIDSTGTIVARDGWRTFYDAAGRAARYDLSPLSAGTIAELLDSLIDQSSR